jgi:hypothetical protein
MSTRCIAPSEIVTPQAASAFGAVAESIIDSDYLTQVGRTTVFPVSTKDFIDFTHGFGNIPLVIAFLKTNNPHLSVSQLAVMSAAGLVKIADIITHDPPIRTEFYEIKPNSADGVPAGQIKVASIAALFSKFSLPYLPGAQYAPDKRIKIFSGNPLGSRLELFFHFKWIQPGLIVYEICAEGDLEELGLKILVAIIAAAIVALLVTATGGAGAGVLVLA